MTPEVKAEVLKGVILTFVWTDGLGWHQARCDRCEYRGRWFAPKSAAKAADQAKAHGAAHAEEGR